ncbi:hypothetical protein RJT34_02549 [Clitoria ternatea]|uniref:Uncharacterized protein n=1 Tax=Clitoria ternatea TaxID=43366 RepID=A0AAN9KK50_CLITE
MIKRKQNEIVELRLLQPGRERPSERARKREGFEGDTASFHAILRRRGFSLSYPSLLGLFRCFCDLYGLRSRLGFTRKNGLVKGGCVFAKALPNLAEAVVGSFIACCLAGDALGREMVCLREGEGKEGGRACKPLTLKRAMPAAIENATVGELGGHTCCYSDMKHLKLILPVQTAKYRNPGLSNNRNLSAT